MMTTLLDDLHTHAAPTTVERTAPWYAGLFLYSTPSAATDPFRDLADRLLGRTRVAR